MADAREGVGDGIALFCRRQAQEAVRQLGQQLLRAGQLVEFGGALAGQLAELFALLLQLVAALLLLLQLLLPALAIALQLYSNLTSAQK